MKAYISSWKIWSIFTGNGASGCFSLSHLGMSSGWPSMGVRNAWNQNLRIQTFDQKTPRKRSHIPILHFKVKRLQHSKLRFLCFNLLQLLIITCLHLKSIGFQWSHKTYSLFVVVYWWIAAMEYAYSVFLVFEYNYICIHTSIYWHIYIM